MSSPMETLKTRLAEVNALHAADAVLGWDQQCFMPKGGADARAEHSSVISRLAHELFVAEETQRAVEDARKDVEPDSEEAAMLRVVKRNLDVETKLPAALVAERAMLAAKGHEIWVEARSENDFKKFQPILEHTVDISRRVAGYLGYKDHIYDPVTDQFEEGATKAYWDAMFDSIRQPLVNLVAEIADSKNQPDDSMLTGKWDEKSQRAFSMELLKEIGFDLRRGRLDTAPHPFCTNFSVGDVRLTTRFLDYLPSAIFGTLHEAGHGMYEQGSPMAWDRTPLAGGVSLGWHESQSRTWENIVGRSKPFWNKFLPRLQSSFPGLGNLDLDSWYRAVNRVKPTLIRVEADEVTYNLHIMIRYELETAMLAGEVEIAEVPELWNSKYQSYLGITPPSDKDGCLQDVHWSGGMLGYFPTYSMGNILSYQVWGKLQADIGDTDALMADGNFKPILDWLIANVYSHGQRYQPQELIRRVCGEPLNAKPYLDGIAAKYRGIYGI